MMKSVKGTETEKNLLKSFAGESQARNRYTYFASVAKNEGYFQVSQIFEETANQEKEHAKRFFNLLEGGELEVTAAFPAGKTGTTHENLKAAAMGEHYEQEIMYPEFAAIARKEGFEHIAIVYEMVAVAERQHERRYHALSQNLEKGQVFKKSSSIKWRCLNCGFIHEGTGAPESCPACAHPQSYFEVLAENW
jgi:rubrerythrin